MGLQYSDGCKSLSTAPETPTRLTNPYSKGLSSHGAVERFSVGFVEVGDETLDALLAACFAVGAVRGGRTRAAK